MKKSARRLLALLLCLALLLSAAALCFADVGGGAGDGDFGGGDDWGGGGDWDDDWGGGDRSTGGGGSLSLEDIVIYIIIFAVIFVVYTIWQKLKQKFGLGKPRRTVVTAKSLPALQPIESYVNLDPGFRAADLQQKLSNLYVRMQQDWTAKDFSPMRPYFSDAYYAQLERQLETLTKQGRTNYVDRITVLSVELLGWMQEGGNDHIYATVKTRIVDYTKDDATGKLVSGSDKAEKFMTYRWHLVRPTGETTTQQGGVRSLSCPHCGAPLNINETAKCPYCDSIITVEAKDFVITEMDAISQVTNR